MQGELKNLSKDATDLEVKTKSLKTDITAKNKHIKELEKEVSMIYMSTLHSAAVHHSQVYSSLHNTT